MSMHRPAIDELLRAKNPYFTASLDSPDWLRDQAESPLSGSGWIKNFHYPLGIPPLAAQALLDVIPRATRFASSEPSRAGAAGLQFCLVGPFVFLRELDAPTEVGHDPGGHMRDLKGSQSTFRTDWSAMKDSLRSNATELSRRVRESASSSPQETIEILRETLAYQEESWQAHFRFMYLSLSSYHALAHFLSTHGFPRTLLSDLLGGEECSAQRLDQLMYELATGGGDPALEKRMFDRIIQDFGLRLDSSVDPSTSTWTETPELLRMRLSRLASRLPAPSPTELLSKARARRDAAERELFERLSPVAAAAASAALARARESNFLWWNEDHPIYLDLLASVPLRFAALRAGQQLTLSGILPSVEAIFYLHIHEIEAALEARNDLPLAELVAARSKYHYYWKTRRHEVPFILGPANHRAADPVLLELHSPAELAAESQRFSGMCAAEGTAYGRIVWVESSDDVAAVTSDSIIACDQLLPSWRACLLTARGCICRRGGLLSHGAITCREYGIPCIVGAREFSPERFTNGALVCLDASNTMVTFLESPQS